MIVTREPNQSTSATTVVLLHESSDFYSTWRNQLSVLQIPPCCISIDLTSSLNARHGSALVEYTSRIAKLLHGTVPTDRAFHLFGQGIGAPIALRLAHRLDNRILGLRLFEPSNMHLLPPGDITCGSISGLLRRMESNRASSPVMKSDQEWLQLWGMSAPVVLPRKSTFGERLRVLSASLRVLGDRLPTAMTAG